MDKKDNISKVFLIREYQSNKKSIAKIARIINCSPYFVYCNLDKYNISRRTLSESAKNRPTLKGKKAPGYKDGRFLKTYYCIDCNKKISGYRAKRCISCGCKEKLKNPKNSPNYIDGRSYEPYPQEFTSKLKLKIRERDDTTCQNCGMIEEEHLIVIGQVLHSHHIDYNKKNCKEENLITLCLWCNIRANRNREHWKENFKATIEKIKNKNGGI